MPLPVVCLVRYSTEWAVKFQLQLLPLGPTFENGVDDFLDVIEIGFGLEIIVDPV